MLFLFAVEQSLKKKPAGPRLPSDYYHYIAGDLLGLLQPDLVLPTNPIPTAKLLMSNARIVACTVSAAGRKSMTSRRGQGHEIEDRIQQHIEDGGKM